MSVVGSIGRTAEYKGNDEYFQDSNIVWLDTDSNVIDKRFLQISYQIIDWIIEGSTVKHLYNDNILASQIWMTSLDEQRKIGEYFYSLDDLITLHQRELNLLKDLKKTLLQQMFI
ncbi:Type I restriction modification DNA specificity domain protein [compost metagenome]